jgi:DegV family protein with EDD domain
VGAVRKVALVTDSSTCLPLDLVEALAIRVVPITVHLPDVDRVDGSDQLSRRISEAVERDQYVRSSHPFITDYLAAIEDCGTAAVVVVTPAMEFAGMYRNAALAAELSRATAVAVDSRTAAAGQALVVLAGAEAAARGAPLDEVLAVIEDASRRVDLVASLEALEPIRRSRRVPSNALRRLGLEGTRSVFRMRDGGVEPLGDVATADLALEAIREAWSCCPPPGPERCTVFHADCPDLAARLEATIGRVDFVSGFSAAMQIHTGRGVVGAAWLEPSDGG